MRASDALLIPFSLLWGSFAIFWEVSVLKTPSPGFFAIFGAPFVLAGLYMIVGRFFSDSYIRSKTAYGVTNRRAILISGVFSRTVKSLPLHMLSDLSMTEKRDGSGTITFGPVHPAARWTGGGGQNATPSFEMIVSAKDVYNRIRQAQVVLSSASG